MASIYDWSLLAANNANSDSDINWAEGQAPSTVNNSARFMMQRLKEFVSDLGAITAVGGSANVLTFSAKSSFSTYSDGIRLTFRASADNTGSVTLNVNAAGAKPVVKYTVDGETALSAGEIQAGGIYEVVYSTALSGATGGWLVLNPTNVPEPAPQAVASGLIFAAGMSTVPTGWLECNGAAVSRTTYANLFAAIGVDWGAGDGSTTFNLPELRGEFPRGWDHGRGIDAGRAFASSQAVQTNRPTQLRSNVDATADFDTVTIPESGESPEFDTGGNANVGASTRTMAITMSGTETRPRNVAVMFVIKT